MKKVFLSVVVVSIMIIGFSFAEESVIDLKPPGKASTQRVVVKEGSPKLVVAATVTATNLVIELTDGKQKFGAPAFRVKLGENSFFHPRLSLVVPVEKVKAVTEASPLLVGEFTHQKEPYQLTLVKGDVELPKLVIAKK